MPFAIASAFSRTFFDFVVTIFIAPNVAVETDRGLLTKRVGLHGLC